MWEFWSSFDPGRKSLVISYSYLTQNGYVNAQTAGGGYPGWLSNVPDTARSNGSDFTAAWKPYIQQVSKYVAPYQNLDGPVILMQRENEFSMDNPDDATTYEHTDHMRWIMDEIRANGITRVPIWKQVNTTLDASHQKRNLAEPLYLAEFQGGAFDPWGGPGYEACHQLINHQPISEDRSLTLKYSEIKLQAMFLHATPHYLLAGRTSNDTLHASLSYIFTTHLATLQAQNLYIIRQTSTARTGLAEFDPRVNTTQGEILLQAVTLDGRESKIIVREYPFGTSVLVCSSAEVATWMTLDGHNHIFLYTSNSTTRTTLYTRASTITASDPLFTATISNGTTLITGRAPSSGLVRVTTGTASVWIADKAWLAPRVWAPQVKNANVQTGPILALGCDVPPHFG